MQTRTVRGGRKKIWKFQSSGLTLGKTAGGGGDDTLEAESRKTPLRSAFRACAGQGELDLRRLARSPARPGGELPAALPGIPGLRAPGGVEEGGGSRARGEARKASR